MISNPAFTSSANSLIAAKAIARQGLCSGLSTYWPTKWPDKWRCNQHTSADQTHIPCVPVASPGREDVKSRCSGALKPDRLGLSYKANKCSDAGTGDLSVLPTHETSPWLALDDASSTRPG